MSSASRSPTRTRRRSRRSGRQSTTSRPTSRFALPWRGGHSEDDGATLAELIDRLPERRKAAVFTHASWAADRTASYERLEFLGDSVLELAVARTLYDRFPEFSEGRLAKIRSHVVSRASCAVVSQGLGLGERLREAAPELAPDEAARLATNRNVLAALLEAALAAVYLEHGFEKVEPAIVQAFEPRIEYALTGHVDHKTELQEAVARAGSGVTYVVLEVEGPPHERTFTAAAVVAGEQVGVGRGRSKKDAEQAAAEQALAHLALEAEVAAAAAKSATDEPAE